MIIANQQQVFSVSDPFYSSNTILKAGISDYSAEAGSVREDFGILRTALERDERSDVSEDRMTNRLRNLGEVLIRKRQSTAILAGLR